MKKLIRSLRTRLKSRRGESVAEVLISLLVSSVALLLLAGMLGSAGHLIQESKEKMSTYYTNSNALTLRSSAAPGSVTEETGSVTYVVKDHTDAQVGTESVNVVFYVNQAAGRDVVSYRKANG